MLYMVFLKKLIKLYFFGIIRNLIYLSMFLFNLLYYCLSKFLETIKKRKKKLKMQCPFLGISPEFWKGTVL
jgi:hypothetical protein